MYLSSGICIIYSFMEFSLVVFYKKFRSFFNDDVLEIGNNEFENFE